MPEPSPEELLIPHVEGVLRIVHHGEVYEQQARALMELSPEDRRVVMDAATTIINQGDGIHPGTTIDRLPDGERSRAEQLYRALAKPVVSPTFVQRFGTRRDQVAKQQIHSTGELPVNKHGRKGQAPGRKSQRT